MPRPRPPYLHRERNRHGDFVWYVRRHHGARIRLKSVYDTAEFWTEYRLAIEGAAPATVVSARAKPHTLAWGLERYRKSPASPWALLSPATRRQSENIYRSVVAAAGGELMTDISPDTIRAGRDRRASAPHAANNFLKSMRRFFKWASDPDGGALLKKNPTLGVKLLKGKNKDGFHTWSDAEIRRFEERWPIGTRERLALDLLLYTGLSRGDVVRLGRQHVSNGVIAFRMEKARGDGVVYPPILPILAATIAASRTGDLTFLVTERGTPFVKESFGNWFGDACRLAECPGSAHGLRKAGATRAAENGATVHQLMALYGWKTEKMALVYTRKADRRRLAAQAGPLLMLEAAAATAIGDTEQSISNEKRPHLRSGAGVMPKTPKNSGA